MRWQSFATSAVLVLLGVLGAELGHADDADAKRSPRGYGSKGFVWERMTPEQVEVMRLSGDAERGRETYRQCAGCHRAAGVGRSDGAYPRLTGQHAAVIIKQITDTRAGIRTNPKMEPFSASHALGLQEIADVAEYLSLARSMQDNGKGDAVAATRGQALYVRLACADCHGRSGEGNMPKLYPVVAAQHYEYLLREMVHIQAGTRGNSHPDMVKSLRGLAAADLQALASYMSRLADYRGPAR